MISIITAIYNQLPMNIMFWDYLKRYTDTEFELIIIDNNSTDGSREFFESKTSEGVVLIKNEANYSYPHCQNQGVSAASGDVLVFLNNDLLVSPNWDSRLLEFIGKDGYEVVSLGSNDRLFSKRVTAKISRRFKLIKYPVAAIFGQRGFALRLIKTLCYGNWSRYCERNFKKYGYSTAVGFSGSAIAMTRAGIEKIGLWDIAQQAADFNTFYKTCERAEKFGDMAPISIINGIFVHHYRRLTLYASYPPFADRANLRSLPDRWSKEEMERWNEKLINY